MKEVGKLGSWEFGVKEDEGRGAMDERTMDEGRGTKKEREIKKVRKLENRKRNAGWINPINLIN